MIITLEISYYPLGKDYIAPITKFIESVENKNLMVEVGSMSTLITGDYNVVMEVITNSMKDLMDVYPSVFNLKISNSCYSE
ncbi:MAG: YkoF family thiamine/hydroxymethylpyrimidine-binding protein [Bacteroidota bacterium]